MIKRTHWFLFVVIFLSSAASSAAQSDSPTLCLIIDDLGGSLKSGTRAISLPGDITYAILPHLKYSKKLAHIAHTEGKELILHAPMANIDRLPLGPGGLKKNQTKRQIQRTLQDAIVSVPYIKGINNHMGSSLTQMEKPMYWVMQLLKQHELYFVDSRTTSKTVAWRIAEQQGVPSLARDIFLDHERTWSFVDSQFKSAISFAKKYGHVVVIAHPYSVTLDYLEKALPELKYQGVRLVRASTLINYQQSLMSQLEPVEQRR